MAVWNALRICLWNPSISASQGQWRKVDLPSVPCTQAGLFETFEMRLGKLQNLVLLDLEFHHFRVLLFVGCPLDEHVVQFHGCIKAQVRIEQAHVDPRFESRINAAYSVGRQE
jgi:hypothetical protein